MPLITSAQDYSRLSVPRLRNHRRAKIYDGAVITGHHDVSSVGESVIEYLPAIEEKTRPSAVPMQQSLETERWPLSVIIKLLFGQLSAFRRALLAASSYAKLMIATTTMTMRQFEQRFFLYKKRISLNRVVPLNFYPAVHSTRHDC